MKNAHVERSHRPMSQHMPHEKTVHPSRDYFDEALRILDNDIALKPQREHLAALWEMLIGLTRRLSLNARIMGMRP